MESVRADDVMSLVAEALDVPASPDSPETLSSLIRVAAGFRCPCKRRTLIDEVVGSLSGLVVEVERERVSSALEALLSYGDLLEAETRASGSEELIKRVYARPPSFVRRINGDVLLVGLSELDQLPLPSDLQSKVVRKGHTRRINGEDAAPRLLGRGFIEIASDAWGWTPDLLGAAEVLSQYDVRLDAASIVRDVQELRVLDPDRPVDFYQGRWVNSLTKSGRFLVRRPRKYGSDLWGYALFEEGRTVRLLDITDNEKERACDQAWRLQMALDHLLGHAQQFSVREVEGRGTRCLSLFSPVPQWAQRRWDNLGEPVEVYGALLSYEFSVEDVDDEAQFCSNMLWLDGVDRGIARERTET